MDRTREKFLILRDSIFDHPKINTLREMMGWDDDKVLGFLARFWHRVQVDAPTGVFAGFVTPEVVFCSLRVTPKIRPVLLEAMLAVGLLDRAGDGTFTVHNWHQHGGKRDAIGEVRAEAGRKGGQAKRKQEEANAKQTASKAEANPKQTEAEVRSNIKETANTLNARAGPEIVFAGARLEVPAALRQVAELPENLPWLGAGVLLEWLRAGHPPDEIISAINKTADARRKGKSAGVNYTAQILRERRAAGYPMEKTHAAPHLGQGAGTRTRTNRTYAD